MSRRDRIPGRPPGRPKGSKTRSKAAAKKPGRQFSDDEIKLITDSAFHGCTTKAISLLVGCSPDDLEQFRDMIAKKRAEYQYNLHKAQNRLAHDGNPAMLIFLGKNVLGQRDRTEQSHTLTLASIFGALAEDENQTKTDESESSNIQPAPT